MERRDPYDGLDDTLSTLASDHDVAVGDQPVGARGQRKRPRYRSEAERRKLTVDVSLEPSLPTVLHVLAGNPPAAYGEGAIRQDDLAAAALVYGLLAYARGELPIEGEWTIRSRGRRTLVLCKEMDDQWDLYLEDLKIDRFAL